MCVVASEVTLTGLSHYAFCLYRKKGKTVEQSVEVFIEMLDTRARAQVCESVQLLR